MNALPQTKAAAEGIDQYLAAVGGGLVGVGQVDVQFCFSLRKSSHTTTSP